jgi:C-terminal peptidase prc
MNGLLQRLDRHSTYMTPDEFKSFSQDLLNPEYGGIGAYVGNDPEDELFTITRPIYSGPAYRAGLKSGDKIVRIGDWPTLGKETDEIIKRLKGKPGTDVKLYIWQSGMDGGLIDRPTEDMAVHVTRERILIPPVQAEYLPGKIGLIELTTFSRDCSQLMRDELEEMMEMGLEGVVLDLRRNLGGLLTEARDVVDLFLEPGKLVVYTESRIEAPERLSTRRPALIPEDVPVVVLIDRFSASASEIVSGALQDHGRAQIVGQRSFGKGSVQNIFSLRGEKEDEFIDENRNRSFDEWETITKDHNGNGEFDFAPKVKMTISRYMLPSGRSIHRELDREGNLESPGGVSPDIEAEPRKWPQWKREEFLRLTNERAVRKWADEKYPEHKELFVELARSDKHDPNLYPGFEEFYTGLDTVLPRNDVRFLMRNEVRRRVQDDRGAAFPAGDYGEDPMLQEGIRSLFDQKGESYFDIDEYATVFDLSPRKSTRARSAAADEENEKLDGALALLGEARKKGGQLSMEEIQGLIELLHSLED